MCFNNIVVLLFFAVQYLVCVYNVIKVWRKNPKWSLSCCLAILLPLIDLKGEVSSLAGKDVLNQQLQTGETNKPTISSTFRDTGAVEFDLEEIDESNLTEARSNTTDIGREAEQISKCRGITSNRGDVRSIHELPRLVYETSF